jgi:isoleucyl-tRNA synthetase
VPREVETFIDDLSTWYVRRNRRRFWKPAAGPGGDDDKLAAYGTLYTCLHSLVRLLAPLMPFLTEEIYQNLVRSGDPTAPESVHLCACPEPDPGLLDADLEHEVEMVRSVVSLGHAAREKARLKVRQPLSSVIIAALPAEREAYLRHADAIREELNVRDLLFTEPGATFPADHEAVREGERAVGINTRLTRELEDEGLARELVHKVQNLRKQAGFAVTDRILLFCTAEDRLTEAIAAHHDYITRETLTLNVSTEPLPAPAIESALKVNGLAVRLALARVEA